MAHKQQKNFVFSVKQNFPHFFENKKVLEVGSFNTNGSIRCFFDDCYYIGVDCQKGKDVDVVCLAHEYKSKFKFDVVCSCETFEHDPYMNLTLINMLELLNYDGLLLFTCAGPRRPEHGTIATDGQAWGPNPNYYQNINKETIVKLLKNSGFFFSNIFLEENENPSDIYCCAIKSIPNYLL